MLSEILEGAFFGLLVGALFGGWVMWKMALMGFRSVLDDLTAEELKEYQAKRK